jgi:hypothetical protein
VVLKTGSPVDLANRDHRALLPLLVIRDAGREAARELRAT